MHALTITNNTPMISSADIAELVSARHDNVRVTVERLVERGVIALPAMQGKSTNGRPSKEYVFVGEQGKRDSIVIVAQLSPEFTARLVDRWQELERQTQSRTANPTILTRMDLIRLAMEAEEQRLELEQKVIEQAPKVEALNRLEGAAGSICITRAAKNLQLRPTQLFHWLQENSWIYRHPGNSRWLAYQQRLTQGVLSHKVSTVLCDDGTKRVCEQVLVTAKGLAKLAVSVPIPART